MLHSAWLRWGALLGAILFLLLLSLSVEPPQAAVGAPGFAPTSIVDDQSPNNMSVNIMVGQVATPGAAGTPGVYAPLAASSGGALSNSVQGRVGATTPVTGVNPVLMAGQDYSNNLQPLHVAPPATGDNSGDLRLQTSAFVQGQSTAGNTMVDILANPTTGALLVDARTNQIAAAATIVLPAQTPVAYTALDAMAAATPAAMTFSNMCRQNGGSGTLVKARQMTDQSSNAARIRVHLFNTAPTPITDNAQFTLLFNTAANYVGYVDLPPNSTEGTGSTAAAALNTDARLPYLCSSSDTNLYALVETLDAFTPASAQNWFFSLVTAMD